jgi:PAS domain S-box-containing protein
MEKKSILVVEDEQIAAMDLKDTLISLGYRVTGIASSGEQAIGMVDAETPDLILMDIRLSGKLSGIEAAEEILRRHAVPIIYLTAYANPDLVDRAKMTKSCGYLLKPYDERSIRTEIDIALYKSGLDHNFRQEYEKLEQWVIERTNELTRMNAALQKSETRYRLLFERSGEGIFIIETGGKDKGRIVDVNAAGAAMHGYRPEELLKMKITDLGVPENIVDAPSRLAAIMSGEWIGGEVCHVRKDGSVFPIDFHAGLLDLDSHNYVFLVIRDISEQKRIRDDIVKTRDEWELTFNAVTDLIAIIDNNFRIVRVNKAMADRLGTSPERAAGLCCYEAVHHSTCPPDLCPHRLLLSDGMPHTVDIHEENLNGDFILSVAPVFGPDGRVSGGVHVLHDITDRKQAEELREHLIHELGQKNAELERFTYSVSHDLKSPLITIKGFVGLLELDARQGDQVQLKKDIHRITAAADTMQELLTDVLELSRIGKMVKPPEKTPFGTIVHKAVDLLAGPLAERDVTVEIEPGLPDVNVDHTRIREVMANLIENAVKFLGDQENPIIRIGVDWDGETPVFFVQDNGIGIDPQYLERIFNLFEKLDVSAQGTGIGLTIARRIIEVHGGRIWAESEGPGKGTSFRFTLPGATEADENPDGRSDGIR